MREPWDDPDPGVHAMIDWLLRHKMDGPQPRLLDWGGAEALRQIDAERKGQPADGRRWTINGQGHTMVHFSGPVEFRMGSPLSEKGHYEQELWHWRRIERSFAIASKKVTVLDFQAFGKAHPAVKQHSPDPDGPIVIVTWYDAAQYCRWLSEQEGIPEEEMCYPSIEEIEKSKDGVTPLRLPADYLSRKGYRLPTEAEWEYACRAEATTPRFYGGGSEDLLAVYAWYNKNSQDRAWPVGQKRPNDFGLFDMHGNAWDWCQESIRVYEPDPEGHIEDKEDGREIVDKLNRVLRGGSFGAQASNVRSADRSSDRPLIRRSNFGLRMARTL
jgi:formylglycine-generating enzyme required for sulfatase activity